jgi:hypothetical protein
MLNSAPFQFIARDVHGGDGLEHYTVATLNEFSRGGVLSNGARAGVSVKVRGEGLVEIEKWSQADPEVIGLWVRVRWTFLVRRRTTLKRVGSVSVTVKLVPGRPERLLAELS